MANYSLVINSRFSPFSYQEMLAPTLMATQAHQELENQYGELATKASVWEEMANEQTDPYAYKMYKTYANDLEEQAGQLAREGLNAASRRDMLNMRARYSKEIVPIETAYKRREADIAAQKEIMLKDPTHLFNRRASEVSLDEYLGNQNLDVLSDNYSRELLTQQVSQAAANLKQTLMKKGALTALGLPYQYERMIQYGASADDVLAAISKDPKAMPILTKLVEDVMAASGIRKWSSMNGDWANNPTYQAAEAAAMRGLYSAIGTSKIDHFTDSFNMQDQLNARQHARQVAAQKAAERRAEQQRLAAGKGYSLNPSNVYSSREKSKKEKKYNDALKYYSKYFHKDANGRITMTKEGWKEYNRPVYGKVANKVMVTPEGTTILVPSNEGRGQTAFRKFMDSIGAYKVTKGKWQPGNLGHVWNRYVTNSPEAETAKYDAMKTSEYIYDVPANDEYQNNFKSKLSRAIGSSGVLKEVDYNPKTNKWEATGKTLPFSKFDTKDYKLVSRVPSEIGTTWFIKKDKETAKRYLAVPGVHTTAEGGRDEAITQMLTTQRMLQNPNLTPQQRTKLEDYYDNLTQQQIMFESQLDLTNQTSAQSFNPYYIP